MNLGGRRNGRRGTRLRRRVRIARTTQPMVVVAQTQRRRRIRRRGRPSGDTSGGPRGRGGSRETFVFSKDSIAGSASGKLTFGASLSECAAFSGGILKAYHEYKITKVILEFISEAPYTAAGSIAYELDPHNKLSTLASTINKFSIVKGGKRAYTSKQIGGGVWRDSSEDQFAILYKGSGNSSVAGSFRITMEVHTQNPK
ncbi:P3 [Maize yellow dwarf virus RMV]|nr:P3 [Maize yellow dwarf virus RMV]AGN49062.1 P3 [Maize yellow dwarf virus RMV]